MILVRLMLACTTLPRLSQRAPKLSGMFGFIENSLEQNIKNIKYLRWFLYFCTKATLMQIWKFHYMLGFI